MSPISFHVTCKEHARTCVQVPEQETHWCHPGGVAKTTEFFYFFNEIAHVLIVQYLPKETGLMLWNQASIILLHQRLYSIHPAQEKVWLSVITLVIPQSFHSERDGFLVARDFESLLLHPFIPVSSRSQSRRDTQLPVPFITAPTTSSLRGETGSFARLKMQKWLEIHTKFALDWGLFTERAADCPPTLSTGLIELICACPAAHSARLKMQKDSRQRRGRTKQKKRCHRPCGEVETELKEKTERGRMRG